MPTVLISGFLRPNSEQADARKRFSSGSKSSTNANQCSEPHHADPSSDAGRSTNTAQWGWAYTDPCTRPNDAVQVWWRTLQSNTTPHVSKIAVLTLKGFFGQPHLGLQLTVDSRRPYIAFWHVWWFHLSYTLTKSANLFFVLSAINTMRHCVLCVLTSMTFQCNATKKIILQSIYRKVPLTENGANIQMVLVFEK
jgi:hypothetical protein